MMYLLDLQFLKNVIIGHEIRGDKGRLCALDVSIKNVDVTVSSMDFKSSWPTHAFTRDDKELPVKF